MAVRAVAMDVKMAAALDGGVGNVAEFCRRQGITRTTFYKWRNRVQTEGIDSLHERSRRPSTSPGATAADVEDRMVRIRKELADNGDCNGPESIRDRLLRQTRRDAVKRGWTPRRVQQARGSGPVAGDDRAGVDPPRTSETFAGQTTAQLLGRGAPVQGPVRS